MSSFGNCATSNGKTSRSIPAPFVLCGHPIRRPEPGTLKYTRRNGRFVLEMVGYPDFGLPFGQDRLIPLWVATLAVRQKSKTVLFRSAAEIVEEFELPRDGPHYQRLVDGFKRIFTSTIYFGNQCETNRNQLWDYRRFHFFDRRKVWYANEKALHRPQPWKGHEKIGCRTGANRQCAEDAAHHRQSRESYEELIRKNILQRRRPKRGLETARRKEIEENRVAKLPGNWRTSFRRCRDCATKESQQPLASWRRDLLFDVHDSRAHSISCPLLLCWDTCDCR